MMASPRAEFRARLAKFADDHPELNAPEAAAEFAQTLARDERVLVAQFLTAEAHNILAWELRAHNGRTRNGIFAAIDISNPDYEPVTTMEESKKESLFDKISQWQEFVPSQNRTHLVSQFTRPVLLESAQYDAGRMAHFGWKMLLKQELAKGLPDDVTTVADVYTPDQIAELGAAIRSKIAAGNFRLKIQFPERFSLRKDQPKP